MRLDQGLNSALQQLALPWLKLYTLYAPLAPSGLLTPARPGIQLSGSVLSVCNPLQAHHIATATRYCLDVVRWAVSASRNEEVSTRGCVMHVPETATKAAVREAGCCGSLSGGFASSSCLPAANRACTEAPGSMEQGVTGSDHSSSVECVCADLIRLLGIVGVDPTMLPVLLPSFKACTNRASHLKVDSTKLRSGFY